MTWVIICILLVGVALPEAVAIVATIHQIRELSKAEKAKETEL